MSSNQFYISANTYMDQSEKLWDSGEAKLSWKYSLHARFAYVCDAIINLVLIPFGILKVAFSGLKALIAWDRNLPEFIAERDALIEKTNHFFLSICGCILSPALAHKYKDANLAPYIIAVRIVVITIGILYFYLKKSP